MRVLDRGFSSPPARGAHSGEKVDLQVQKRGRVDAVGYRWRMDLGFGEGVSNEEDADDFQDHWWQMAQPLDAPFEIGPGVPFSLKASHTDTDIKFDVFFDASEELPDAPASPSVESKTLDRLYTATRSFSLTSDQPTARDASTSPDVVDVSASKKCCCC